MSDEIDVPEDLARTSFMEIFGKEPYPFQMEVLQHMLPMIHHDTPSRPVFLCQPTGGGKSAVRDTYGSAAPGITLSLSPLLALNGDQTTKLNTRTLSCGIRAVHYDQFRQDAKIGELEDTIIDEAQRMSIVLFCSPQMLTDRKESQAFLERIMRLDLLRQVCIDEVHLFVEFGLYFRSEFVALRPILFDKLVKSRSNRMVTVCPILVMTATATKELLEYVQSMTGLAFHRDDIFWPDVHGMKCRNQTIQFMPHAQPIRFFKPLMRVLVASGQMFIYYSNRRINVERATVGLTAFLDGDNLPGDVVCIIGPFSRDQKFHRTQLFLNPDTLPRDSLGGFCAVGCVTTRSLGAAGWDSDSIHLVFSADMVTNILSLAQEKGRAGRRDGADGSDDVYIMAFDLDDYLYLVQRAHRGASGDDIEITDFESLGITLEEYTRLQLADLSEVLRFYLIPNECQHCILERRLANPYTNSSTVLLEPCGNRCQFCNDNGAVHGTFERFVRAGVQQALVHLFFSADRLIDPTLNGEENLIVAMVNFPNAQKLFFDSNANKKPEKAAIKRLLMMLLVADLLAIRYVVEWHDAAEADGEPLKTDKLVAYVPMLPPPPPVAGKAPALPSCTPALTDDSRWASLPLRLPK